MTMTIPALLRELAEREERLESLQARIAGLQAELDQARELAARATLPARMNPVLAAQYIGRKPKFLERDRLSKNPAIPCVRLGRRTVLYDRAALDEYLKQTRAAQKQAA